MFIFPKEGINKGGVVELGKSICILIAGKAGVGKDVVAELLDYGFSNAFLETTRYKFATDVKTTAFKMGWNNQKDEKGRKLLQEIGKVGRRYDVDLWCKRLFNTVREDYPNSPPDVLIVSDWRFPNESIYAKKQLEYNVITIRVESPERESLKGTDLYWDESEVSLPNGMWEGYDYLINNETTLVDLNILINELVKDILNKQIKWE